MIKPYYDEDGITIYNADCREVLGQLEPVDLVLTDPPYGLGDKWKTGGWRNVRPGRGGGNGRLWESSIAEWDAAPVDVVLLANVIKKAKRSIVWGGNYFPVEPSAAWLIWNKGAKTTQAQAEMAWTNLNISIRVFDLTVLGAFGNDGANGEKKLHPTQKPLPLMKWCLQQAKDAKTVLDPFMGSGTTLRAAKDLGLRAIGIEIEKKYCDIAIERLRQQVLFTKEAA